MGNVVSHPKRDEGERVILLQAQEARQKLATTELEKALKAFEDCPRLTVHDRECVARNVGVIAEKRNPTKSKQLLHDAFKEWCNGEEQHFYKWNKRRRWARLESDKPKERLSDPASPRPHEYRELATIIGRIAPLPGLPPEASQQDALRTLLSGTSFFPDKSGQSRSDLDTMRALPPLLARLIDEVIRKSPSLPSYFRTVSDHALTHDTLEADVPSWNHFCRNESQFSVCGWGDFGAQTDGHLVPETLCDGYWLNEREGHGVAATFPRVPLAEISLKIVLPALEWRVLLENFADTSLDDTKNRSRIIKRVLANSLFTDKLLAPNFSVAEFESSWRLHLVVAPWGGREPSDLRLALVVEEIAVDPLMFSTGDVQFSEPNDSILVDTRPLHADVLRDLLFAATDRMWLANGVQGSAVLTTKSTSWVEVDTFSPILSRGSTPRIKPLFEVPAVQAAMPIVTLAGMIERNLNAAAYADRLDNRLIADATRRIETLQRQYEVTK
jgi:hypothetical protein